MKLADVVEAWDKAAPDAIHPSRAISESAYWASGQDQAEKLATVLPDGCRVVDFGCGDGRVAKPLMTLGYDVIAVDSSPAMISACGDGLVSDGSDLASVLGKPADALYCLAVLIHHDYESGEQIIGNLVEAVKPGGLLILDWPTNDNPVERKGWIEVTTWSRAEQNRIAKKLNLKRVRSKLPWPVFRRV